MKTLILLRHGKSDWDAGSGQDHERPLAKRGRKAARFMGEFLFANAELPAHIVSSTAIRAATTAELAVEHTDWNGTLATTRALYEAAPDGVLEIIRATEDGIERLMLVGHEPTSSATIGALTGGSQVRVPTACAARIDLPVARWRDVAWGDGELVWLLPPRLLMQAL